MTVAVASRIPAVRPLHVKTDQPAFIFPALDSPADNWIEIKNPCVHGSLFFVVNFHVQVCRPPWARVRQPISLMPPAANVNAEAAGGANAVASTGSAPPVNGADAIRSCQQTQPPRKNISALSARLDE